MCATHRHMRVLIFATSKKRYNNRLTMAKKKGTKSAAGASDKDMKLEALNMATSKVIQSFGDGAIMRLGDNPAQDVEVIPSGSIGLDYALGVGGYPRGRVIEIFGPESSGKTTLAIHAIAEAQKAGGVAAIIDAEHAFDRFYAENLGVDVNNLWIAQPDNGEQALAIAEQLINSGALDIIVIDSVAALTPKSEIDGEMGEKNVGLQARLMSQALRKLTATIARTRTTCIFINQLRAAIGGNAYGPSETTTGGNALKFYSSVRLDIRPSTMIKVNDQPVGRMARVKVVKNKVAPPFTSTTFELIFGQGISRAGEILDLACELGIVKKAGSWFSYGDTRLGQGRENVRDLINDNPELAEELEAKIREKKGSPIPQKNVSEVERFLPQTDKVTHEPIDDGEFDGEPDVDFDSAPLDD